MSLEQVGQWLKDVIQKLRPAKKRGSGDYSLILELVKSESQVRKHYDIMEFVFAAIGLRA